MSAGSGGRALKLRGERASAGLNRYTCRSGQRTERVPWSKRPSLARGWSPRGTKELFLWGLFCALWNVCQQPGCQPRTPFLGWRLGSRKVTEVKADAGCWAETTVNDGHAADTSHQHLGV